MVSLGDHSGGRTSGVTAQASTSANGVRPVLLTEEQARGLLDLRSQLTGRDLMYYSNRLREEAMRRMGNQDAAARFRRGNHNPRSTFCSSFIIHK